MHKSNISRVLVTEKNPVATIIKCGKTTPSDLTCDVLDHEERQF